MVRDNEGNNLEDVKYVLTSKIIITPYDPAKQLTADMIASTVADPAKSLADIFADGGAVGLITSDGAPQDARDADDSIEFHQPGYSLNADPTLTVAFTVAEDNDLTRLMTIGKPDAQGVYHVSDTIQDSKWFAYQETVYKFGQHRRRLGVIQITGNEPAQDTRGEVSGLALTAQWQIDANVDSGMSRYLQSYYTPATSGTIPVTGITVTPDTASVKVDATTDLTVAVTPSNASDKTFAAASSDNTKASVAVNGSKVTVTGKAEGAATITVTSTDSKKTASCAVTVTPKA